jgi:hypothetical protein
LGLTLVLILVISCRQGYPSQSVEQRDEFHEISLHDQSYRKPERHLASVTLLIAERISGNSARVQPRFLVNAHYLAKRISGNHMQSR